MLHSIVTFLSLLKECENAIFSTVIFFTIVSMNEDYRVQNIVEIVNFVKKPNILLKILYFLLNFFSIISMNEDYRLQIILQIVEFARKTPTFNIKLIIQTKNVSIIFPQIKIQFN